MKVFWASTVRSNVAIVHWLFRKYADTLISSPDYRFFVLHFTACPSPVQQRSWQMCRIFRVSGGVQLSAGTVYFNWSGVVLGAWYHVTSVVFHWLCCYELSYVLRFSKLSCKISIHGYNEVNYKTKKDKQSYAIYNIRSNMHISLNGWKEHREVSL